MPLTEQMIRRYKEALASADQKRREFLHSGALDQQILHKNQPEDFQHNLMYVHAEEVQKVLHLQAVRDTGDSFRNFFHYAEEGMSFDEIMNRPDVQASLGENDPEAMKLYYMACREDIALKEENLRIANTFYQNLRYSDQPEKNRELTAPEKRALQLRQKQTMDVLEHGDFGRGFQNLLQRPGITEEEKQHINGLLQRNDLQSRQELFGLYVRDLCRIPEEYLDRAPTMESAADPSYLYYMHISSDYELYSAEVKAHYSAEEQEQIKTLTSKLTNTNFLIRSAIEVYLSGRPYPTVFEVMGSEELSASGNISTELVQYAAKKMLPSASRQEAGNALAYIKGIHRNENIPEARSQKAEAEEGPSILPDQITDSSAKDIHALYQQTFEESPLFRQPQNPLPDAEVPVLPEGETDYPDADLRETAVEQFLHRYGPQIRSLLAAGGTGEEQIRLYYHTTQQYAAKLQQLRSQKEPLNRKELNELLALNSAAQTEGGRVYTNTEGMESFQNSLSSALAADRALLLQIADYAEDNRHSFQADLLSAKVRVHGHLPKDIPPAVSNHSLLQEFNRVNSTQESINEDLEAARIRTAEKQTRRDILTLASRIDSMSFNSSWGNSRPYGQMLDAMKKLSDHRITSPQELIQALKTARETAAAYRTAKDTNFYGRQLEENQKAERATEEGKKRYQLALDIEKTCSRYEQTLNRSWQKLSEPKKQKLTEDLSLHGSDAAGFRVRNVRRTCQQLEEQFLSNAANDEPDPALRFQPDRFAEYYILHQLIVHKQTGTIHRMNGKDLKDRVERMKNSDAMKYMEDYFRNAKRPLKAETLEACYESALQHAKDFEAAREMNYESLEVMIHNLQNGRGNLARKSGCADFDRVMKENKIHDLQGLVNEKKQQRIQEMHTSIVQAENSKTGADGFQKYWLQKIRDQEDPNVNAKIRNLRSADYGLDTSRQYLADIAVSQLLNEGMSVEDIMDNNVGKEQKIKAFRTALDCFRPDETREDAYKPDLKKVGDIVGPAWIALTEKTAECAKKIDFAKGRMNTAEYRKFTFMTNIAFDINQSVKELVAGVNSPIGDAIRASIQAKYNSDVQQTRQIYENLNKCNDIADLLLGPKSEINSLSIIVLRPQSTGNISNLLKSTILAKETARQNGGKLLASFSTLQNVRRAGLETAITRQTAGLQPFDTQSIYDLHNAFAESQDYREFCTSIENDPAAAELLMPSILDGSLAESFHFENGELTSVPDFEETIQKVKQQNLTMTKKFADFAAEKRKEYQNLPDSYASAIRKDSLNALKEIQRDWIPQRGYTSPVQLQRSSQLMTAIFKADFMSQCRSRKIPKAQAEAALRSALKAPETSDLRSPGAGTMRTFLANKESGKIVQKVLKNPSVQQMLNHVPQAEAPQLRN